MKKIRLSLLLSVSIAAVVAFSTFASASTYPYGFSSATVKLANPDGFFVTGDRLHSKSTMIKVTHGVAGKILLSSQEVTDRKYIAPLKEGGQASPVVAIDEIVERKPFIMAKSNNYGISPMLLMASIGESGGYPMVMAQSKGLLWSLSAMNPTGWFGGTPMSHTLVAVTETI